MSGFKMEKVVKKGSSDVEILSDIGFSDITDEHDGRKTAVKDRIIYGGLSVSMRDADEEQAIATVTYASIQRPLHRDPPAKIDPKKK